MVVMINGSFGIGKTTVARMLRANLKGSALYDPEWTGLVLMRLPKVVPLKGAGTDDFQNIDLWRRSAIAGIKLFRHLNSGPIIVPMTFSQKAYLNEIVEGVRLFDPALRLFCLKASLTTVKQRLTQRGDRLEGPGSEWIARRIVECTDAHRDSDFGESVETEERSAAEVAEDITMRLKQTGSGLVQRNA